VQDFSADEYALRLARLRTAFGSRAVEAMLIDDSEILAYFTGYETSLNRYRACVVPLEGSPVMVLRALDAEPFRRQSWLQQHVAVPDSEDVVLHLAEALRAYRTIGFDSASHALTVDAWEALRAALPLARFIALPGLPWQLRLVKSSAEISRLRKAAGILDQVIAELADGVAPGVTPRQLLAQAAARLIALGGDPAHIGYVAAASGWDFLHAQPDERGLERGDVLHAELVARYRGYEARVMRCIALGEPPPERLRAAETLVRLQDAQIAAMRPGAPAREVDAILRQGVLASGLRERYDNITGYTLGYYSRQPLRSSDFTRCFLPDAQWKLEAGMVFHMYTSAGGVSLSETVLVGGHGPERLTKLERGLLVAPSHGRDPA
jgi:Xaa-Pro aminopeptidase